MAQIRCVVERVTYQNPENGYSVFRVKVKGYDDLGSPSDLQSMAQLLTMTALGIAGNAKRHYSPSQRSCKALNN